MSNFTRSISISLVLCLAFGFPAHAKKDKGETPAPDVEAQADEVLEIQDIGIPEFDKVFVQVMGINTTLDDFERQISAIERGLLTVIGGSEGASLGDALRDLRGNALEYLAIELVDGAPRIGLSDAAPNEVKSAISAVTEAVESLKGVKAGVQEIQAQLQTITAAAVMLPPQVPAAVTQAGMTIRDVRPTLQKTRENIRVTSQTTRRAVDITRQAGDAVSNIIRVLRGKEDEAAEGVVD